MLHYRSVFRCLAAVAVFSTVGCAATADDETIGDDESAATAKVVTADPARIADKIFSATPTPLTEQVPFVSHGDFYAVAVALPPAQALLKQLNTFLALPGAGLKNRGEAHITALTPSEFSDLRARPKGMETINRIASAVNLQNAAWTPLCIGVGVSAKDKALQTYYVVVESPPIADFRAQLARALGAFEDPADPYHPHITIGFTSRDLFNRDFGTRRDGTHAAKDTASCPRQDNLTLGSR